MMSDLLNGYYGSIAQVFIVIFLASLIDFFQKKILKRLNKKLLATKNPWDDALLESAQKPLSVFIWIVGLTFAVQIINWGDDSAVLNLIDPLRNVSVIVILAWFLMRFAKRAEANILLPSGDEGKDADATTVRAIGKLIRVSIMLATGLVALQTLGFSVSGVLAFGGIGGIAIGFAARDLLANFFGGMMIYLDRPFTVGDWIRSPDQEIEGTVEEIGWRLTRIRTFDKRPLYIPNSIFATIAVENPSRMTHRRIYETIGIRYDDGDKMAAITADVKKMLIEHEAIDNDQTLMVNFVSFAPSSLDFFVYTFTHTTVWTEFHEIKQDIMLRIYNIIVDHGAEIAFPTSTIHVPDEIKLSSENIVASHQ